MGKCNHGGESEGVTRACSTPQAGLSKEVLVRQPAASPWDTSHMRLSPLGCKATELERLGLLVAGGTPDTAGVRF